MSPWGGGKFRRVSGRRGDQGQSSEDPEDEDEAFARQRGADSDGTRILWEERQSVKPHSFNRNLQPL